jgi:hypothetical protein
LVLLLQCLALLRFSLIVCLHGRRHANVAICRKGLADGKIGWPAMIDVRKLRAVGAGDMLVLNLCPHGRSMLLMQSCQFRGSGSHLQSARSAVEAHTGTTAAGCANGAVVDVVHH